MQSAPILLIEGLARWFGKREVIRSLDLRLEPGKRVALRGANGSGKTTVLRCIGGTITPSAGRIAVGGHQSGTLAARRLTGVSLSLERSFYLRLSGHANLLFFSRLRHDRERDAERDVRALEEELEIGEIAAERVDKCSTGMVQQLSFARALLGNPPLLLLDEPTRSLDDAAFGRLWNALDRRLETALVIATHRDDDAAHCHARLNFPR